MWSVAMLRCGILFVATLILTAASAAAGQGDGTMRGHVVDRHDLPLPGVTIKLTSVALPGERSGTTLENGDFIIPFLPPGEYSVSFELKGFQRQVKAAGVSPAETRDERRLKSRGPNRG